MSESKVFDPKKRAKLNNPLRLEWVPPARVAELMDLKRGGEYIDLGAGTGYMSRSIGEHINNSVIHAVDIEPLMVSEMKSSLSDITWIKPALMERDKLPFANASIDGLWCITVFHELGTPGKMLNEIHRVLKPGGVILVIDWLKKQEACEQGPPLDHRIDENDVVKTLQGADFTNTSVESGFLHHFGIIANKN